MLYIVFCLTINKKSSEYFVLISKVIKNSYLCMILKYTRKGNVKTVRRFF